MGHANAQRPAPDRDSYGARHRRVALDRPIHLLIGDRLIAGDVEEEERPNGWMFLRKIGECLSEPRYADAPTASDPNSAIMIGFPNPASVWYFLPKISSNVHHRDH